MANAIYKNQSVSQVAHEICFKEERGTEERGTEERGTEERGDYSQRHLGDPGGAHDVGPAPLRTAFGTLLNLPVSGRPQRQGEEG